MAALAQQLLLSAVEKPGLQTLTTAMFMKMLYLLPNFVVVKAAIGDKYKSDPTALAAAENQLNLVPMLSIMFMPALGGYLAKRFGVMTPVKAAVLFSMINVSVVAVFFEETLAPKDRKPFRWKTSSPLSFLKLFSKTKRLAALTMSELLFQVCALLRHIFNRLSNPPLHSSSSPLLFTPDVKHHRSANDASSDHDNPHDRDAGMGGARSVSPYVARRGGKLAWLCASGMDPIMGGTKYATRCSASGDTISIAARVRD
jgi:hypothetical protein